MDMSKAKSIVAPGELARGCMDRMKMSEPQFARLLNLSEEELESFFSGRLPITKELAFALKEATGLTASFWIGFERTYRHRLAKLEEAKTSGKA